MAKDLLEDVSWQVSYQGKTCYSAWCESEVLIISQDDSLQVADAVPRRICELTDDDKRQLERLNLPQSSWQDDACIMAARYALDKRCMIVNIEKSKPGNQLSKGKVMQLIRDTMKTSTKPAVSIRYIGPGRRNTGDWCFEDGFITFRDIAEYYQMYFKGKIMGITCDCSYGGNWVKACKEYLDEQGVQPCAHSAKEKKLFIAVTASCKHNEVSYRLLYSIRAITNDKNNGTLGRMGDGWEIANDQHLNSAEVVTIECKNKSIDDPCTLGPRDTWRKILNQERIFVVRGADKGRQAWHYVLLVDDDETIRKFKELTQGPNAGKHTIDVSSYGQVLKSGWGEQPPNDVKDWMEENFGAS